MNPYRGPRTLPAPLCVGDRVQSNEQQGDRFGKVTAVNGSSVMVRWKGCNRSVCVAKNKIIVAPTEERIARLAAKFKRQNLRAMRAMVSTMDMREKAGT